MEKPLLILARALLLAELCFHLIGYNSGEFLDVRDIIFRAKQISVHTHYLESDLRAGQITYAITVSYEAW